jgi:hypothetical protein
LRFQPSPAGLKIWRDHHPAPAQAVGQGEGSRLCGQPPVRYPSSGNTHHHERSASHPVTTLRIFQAPPIYTTQYNTPPLDSVTHAGRAFHGEYRRSLRSNLTPCPFCCERRTVRFDWYEQFRGVIHNKTTPEGMYDTLSLIILYIFRVRACLAAVGGATFAVLSYNFSSVEGCLHCSNKHCIGVAQCLRIRSALRCPLIWWFEGRVGVGWRIDR